MKHRFLLLPLLCLAVCLPARADRVLDAFIARASSETMAFSFTMRSGSMRVSGSASVRGSSYVIDAGGLEIWSDGNLRWSVDRDAREVVVEEQGIADVDTGPASLLSGVEASFSLKSSSPASFRGLECHAVTLLPKAVLDGSGIREVILYFRSDELRGLTVSLDDGSSNEFEITGLSFTDKPLDGRFDTSSLGPDWLVTDLRGL